MKRLLAVVFLVGSLAGCIGSQSEGMALMNGCAAAEAGLKIVTALKAQGKLSKIQIARIDLAVHSITPICGSEAIVNPKQALVILEDQLLVLNGVVMQPGSNL